MDLSLLLDGWTFEPTVALGLALSAILYWWGARYSLRRGIGRHLRGWRAACFVAGLLVIFVALESPLDAWADELLWVHMVQHELLTFVAPPLLLLGEPFWPIWRAFPRTARRETMRWVVRQNWLWRLGKALERFFFMPAVAWCTFVLVFSLWHLPALYDLTLENTAVHVLEHVFFLVTGLIFWAQIIPSRPFEPRLDYPKRAAYLGLTVLWGNVLDLSFMLVTTPTYAYYAALSRPAGMVSAVTDEHLAGGIMDVTSTFILITLIMVMVGLWLQADEKAADAMTKQLLQSRA